MQSVESAEIHTVRLQKLPGSLLPNYVARSPELAGTIGLRAMHFNTAYIGALRRASVLSRPASTHEHELWLAIDSSARIAVGTVTLTAELGEPGVYQVGYWVGEAFRGRGVATSALGMLCARCRSRKHRPVLRAHISSSNQTSRGVLKRNGFVRLSVNELLGIETWSW